MDDGGRGRGGRAKDAAVLYYAFKGWMTEEGAGVAEPRCRGSTTEGGLPLQW